MTNEQYIKNLRVPSGPIDVVLDTDAYNEIDDQFAISYMLKYGERFNVKGICAAPFFNPKSTSPKDGMEKSYDEILKLLNLIKKDELKSIVYKGSTTYMPDEQTPVESDAADFIADIANNYSPENPLYIVCIGAITNVASALLKNPLMRENCVIVFLGGRSIAIPEGAGEFNMKQDIAAARIIFSSGVPLIHLTGKGVTDRFLTTKYELEHWLSGKNDLCDYLYSNVIEEAESYAKGTPWSRVIWDVVAVAWLLNYEQRFMHERIIPSPMPEYDLSYSFDDTRRKIKYIEWVNRDELFADLFKKLSE